MKRCTFLLNMHHQLCGALKELLGEIIVINDICCKNDLDIRKRFQVLVLPRVPITFDEDREKKAAETGADASWV